MVDSPPPGRDGAGADQGGGGATEAEIAEQGTILRVLVGSGVHGTAIDGQDDRDEMGICIEPPDHVIGLQRFEQYVFRTQPEGVRSGRGRR